MFLDRSNECGALSSARFDSLSSLMDVSYSCGSCGYPLHLSSSDRNTSNIGPKYRKAMKKGVVSFNSIDESRFCNTDSFICLPYFNSKSSWGLFRRRTMLRCRKCVKYIGSAYEEIFPFALFGRRVSDDSSSGCSKKYKIRISALQPSSDELDSSFITHR